MHQRTSRPDDEPVNPVDALTERLMAGEPLSAVLPALPVPCRAPVLTALAARHLITVGEITVSIIGSGAPVRTQLAALCRFVPGVSHVAVQLSHAELDPPLLDQCYIAGIGLSPAASRCEALYGANLVVFTEGDADRGPAPLPRGTVLVNASGAPLHRDLAAAAERVVVDGMELLTPGSPLAADADLRQVVTGERCGRTDLDQVLLVELLSARSAPQPPKETL